MGEWIDNLEPPFTALFDPDVILHDINPTLKEFHGTEQADLSPLKQENTERSMEEGYHINIIDTRRHEKRPKGTCKQPVCSCCRIWAPDFIDMADQDGRKRKPPDQQPDKITRPKKTSFQKRAPKERRRLSLIHI